MSAQALATDPVLPSLKVAQDDRAMLRLFREHLRPVAGQAFRIHDCRISRMRYHRADRCLIQYTLSLEEAHTGRERSQWVTGSLFAGNRGERLWRKLRASDPASQTPDAFRTFEPITLIPALKMLVQVFPYDRDLPGLRLLADLSAALEPFLLATFGPGAWCLAGWRAEPVQHRPERVAVLRYVARARGTGERSSRTKRIYVKLYRGDEGQRTFEVLERLWNGGNATEAAFTVGRPLGYLSGYRALVQEESRGLSLQRLLLEGSDTRKATRRAASCLAALHLSQISPPSHHRLEDEAAVLATVASQIGWSCPELNAKVSEIVAEVVERLEDVPLRPSHLELKANHIVLNRDHVGLIDLDSFCAADPLLDLSRLLANVVGLPLRFDLPDDGRWRAAQRVLADEYFSHVPAAWRGALAHHYAGAALKEAVGFVRRRTADWPDKVSALLNEARDSLDGKVW